MSTLPGQASKGEKPKPKFQSLDINSLYRVSRGENLEKQQQKSSSVYIKHGMQSLGKVPNARRAPANLPSLKSEHSGTDAAVPLVPPGAPGWGKQDTTNTSGSPSPNGNTNAVQPQDSNAPPLTVPNLTVQPQLSTHQAAIALPVTNTIPPQTHKQLTPSAQPVPTDKLWSSVMSGQETHPPLYQSVQFQHEFPSLSSGDGGPIRTGSDAPQYPSGLSLRPQTEGSWTQGGQRSLGPPGTGGEGVGPGKPGLAHLGAPPQLPVQAGHQQQQQPFPPQIRGVMPSFMYKGNNFQQVPGVGIQNQQTMPPQVNGRVNRPLDNRPPRLADREVEEVAPRPIIREEELSRMDEISKDMGWAETDEIDYNQKLAFSDDEGERSSKREHRRGQQNRDNRDSHNVDNQNRQWSSSRSNASRGRSSEDEDIWTQRRSQQDKEVEIAVQRAKQRKEEEEKRFNEERKQAAAKKLMELEEKIQKRDRDNCEGVGTINPNTIPPKPINHVDIPLPDFQKDKEKDRDKDNRPRTPNESDEKNQHPEQGNSFRQLTQIEGKNFSSARKHMKPSERERDGRDNRDQNGPNFSRQFQSDLPPRFLKHQRNNSNSNLQNQQPQQYHRESYDNRWSSNAAPKSQQNSSHPSLHNRNIRQVSPDIEKEELDRKDYKRQSSEESYRSSHHSQQDGSQKLVQDARYHMDVPENRHQDYDTQHGRRDQEHEKRHKEKDSQDNKKHDEHSYRLSNEDWGDRREKHRDEKPTERDRPQRPDSRDSRSTRHSRDSEPRDFNMGSWSESMYEPSYDEKRKDYGRDERRAVPGPITKDRIEADDMRNEKRNLTQLKRGQPIEVKTEIKNEKKEEVSAWADSIPPALEQAQAKLTEEKRLTESSNKSDTKSSDQLKKTDKSDEYSQNRNRPYGQKKGWGSGESHSTRGPHWPRRPPSRGQKSGNREYPTDSDGSLDDYSGQFKQESPKPESNDQISSKPATKTDKDEKNRDNKEKYGDQKKDKLDRKDNNYVPRGEPSRHGRGGGNFRSGRMGGLGKRIDGYGPPPTKSPFGGHNDDRDKKPIDNVGMENTVQVEDKIKQNQQALAAGIIGKRNEQSQNTDKDSRSRNRPDNRRNKPKPDDNKVSSDSNADNYDEKNKDRKPQQKSQINRSSSNSNRSRNNPPRLGGDKRYESARGENIRQNSNSSLKKDDKSNDHNLFANAIADISAKNRDEGDQHTDDKEDKISVNGDSEGFQEVKSKKNIKERQKSIDDKSSKVNKNDPGKDLKTDRDRKKISPVTQQLTQQQIQNIPSLMATPVNPPPVLPQSKNQFDRPRQTKLPPRFAKQKLQKQAMQQQQQQQQQQHVLGDVNDMNKINHNMNLYVMKDSNVASPVPTCAWDKPLGSQLRNVEHDNMLGVSIDPVKGLESTHSPTQGIVSPGSEKVIGKTTPLPDKTLLDGSTPPVNTIIFENTNFKSAPGSRNTNRADNKPRAKLDEGSIDNAVISSFNKSNMNDLLQTKTDKTETIQLPLFKEDTADMKLDFFSADLQFPDDKTSKNFVSKSIHAITSGNNTVDSLDIKIASVKKVWETSEQESEENQLGFGGPPLDSNVFNQGKDTPDDNHEVYSPSPNQSASTTTNVCKVKPTQQISGSGQTVLSSSGHQPHAGIVPAGLMGHPLSPPPIQQVLGASVGIGPQYTTNQHISYQASLSGSTQYGISAIPSPPTVPLVYNSTQQIQAAAAQSAGLYGAFQIDQLGGQGRSQFSQYPNYHSLSQTANSPYSTQSVYLPTAAPPPHPPPPTAQGPPELYQSMNNYRLGATGPFGQNQQLNNPTTVLISSTSNSLMSASVKPSSQPISAIGTKAGGVGQAYQQQSQQGQQVFMTYDPSIQANYLASSGGVMQRGPVAQAQNNVVPGLQPSSSFYSGSTGGQTGFYQQPSSSSMGSQMQQHQAGYGLQGNMFGTHSQSHTNTGMQNFNSHFLTTPMQMAAAAITAQQFRSGLQPAYMKGVGSQQIGDQSGRPQQLKSPSSQEVLSSVFNSGPQIPSPKSRQNSKHPPPQSSPTAQHKYNLYQGVGGQQNPNLQRYPTPIQRPVNFQQMQQNSVNQKHRSNSNKTPNRQYYGSQNQNDKSDEGKMSETSNATGQPKTTLGTGSSVTVTAEKVKDNIKEEPAALKD